jgi:hypothetical protein
MLSKKSPSYIKTAEEAADKNVQQPQLQLLQADFRNIKYSNNTKNNGIEELKIKNIVILIIKAKINLSNFCLIFIATSPV